MKFVDCIKDAVMFLAAMSVLVLAIQILETFQKMVFSGNLWLAVGMLVAIIYFIKRGDMGIWKKIGVSFLVAEMWIISISILAKINSSSLTILLMMLVATFVSIFAVFYVLALDILLISSSQKNTITYLYLLTLAVTILILMAILQGTNTSTNDVWNIFLRTKDVAENNLIDPYISRKDAIMFLLMCVIIFRDISKKIRYAISLLSKWLVKEDAESTNKDLAPE